MQSRQVRGERQSVANDTEQRALNGAQNPPQLPYEEVTGPK